jgi:hypothetical protein
MTLFPWLRQSISTETHDGSHCHCFEIWPCCDHQDLFEFVLFSAFHVEVKTSSRTVVFHFGGWLSDSHFFHSSSKFDSIFTWTINKFWEHSLGIRAGLIFSADSIMNLESMGILMQNQNSFRLKMDQISWVYWRNSNSRRCPWNQLSIIEDQPSLYVSVIHLMRLQTANCARIETYFLYDLLRHVPKWASCWHLDENLRKCVNDCAWSCEFSQILASVKDNPSKREVLEMAEDFGWFPQICHFSFVQSARFLWHFGNFVQM